MANMAGKSPEADWTMTIAIEDYERLGQENVQEIHLPHWWISLYIQLLPEQQSLTGLSIPKHDPKMMIGIGGIFLQLAKLKQPF